MLQFMDALDSGREIYCRLQAFLTNHMIENDLIPYGMVLVGNDVAKHLQIKFGSQFAEKIFYFYAKGVYEYE